MTPPFEAFRSFRPRSRRRAPFATVSDEALMARFRTSASEAAFDELFRRHMASAYRTALSILRDPSTVEDILQESFLSVVRARRSYEKGRPFAPWFYAIVRNACRDELRRRRPVILPDVEEPASLAESDPGAAVERREEVSSARRAFGFLPEAEREVLALRIYGELTFAEIASICGTTREAAKKRAHRGLARLRRALARRL